MGRLAAAEQGIRVYELKEPQSGFFLRLSEGEFDYRRATDDTHPLSLCLHQKILVERVLGLMITAGHAIAAAGASLERHACFIDRDVCGDGGLDGSRLTELAYIFLELRADSRVLGI